MPTDTLAAPSLLLAPQDRAQLIRSIEQFLLGDNELMDASHYLPLARRKLLEWPDVWLQASHRMGTVELVTHAVTTALEPDARTIADAFQFWYIQQGRTNRYILCFLE